MPLYEQLAGGVALALLTVGLAAWLQAGARWWRGQPIVPLAPRRPAPWKAWDLLAILLVFVAAQILAAGVLRFLFPGQVFSLEKATPQLLTAFLLAQGIANLVIAALAALITTVWAGATPRDLGWSFSDLKSDVALGFVAFAMLAPPVLIIQGVLTRWYPSEHPLTVMLRDHMTWSMFAIGTFVAVIVAPLAEEFFFRVLLQGWLERLGQRRHKNPPEKAIEGLNPAQASAATGVVTAELAEAPAGTPPAGFYQQRPTTWEGVLAGDAATEPPHDPPYWPILLSATIFAMMHMGNGPDPIPLFFLALGLGYLYRQTHRIVPSMTVHFLLNAASMTLLWMELTFGNH